MRFGDWKILLNDGTEVYCCCNTIGLGEDGTMTYGHDGQLGEDQSLSVAQKIEIAEYMVQRWQQHLDRLKAEATPACHICARKLNDPSDPTTQDCGGDCLRCMAQAGDPECVASLKKLQEKL